MKLGNAFKRAGAAWRANGTAGLQSAWWSYRHRIREDRDYRRWIKTREAVANDERRLADEFARLTDRPLISVLLPVYNVDERWLRRCIESVTSQVYQNWELCIADDASPAPHVRRVIEEYAAKDNRIRVVFRDKNGHISAASNSALDLASGKFVVLLDHDDELSRDAVLRVAMEIEAQPETALIYSDEDLIDESGRRFAPKFKPDFSRDLLYSLNLLTHLSAFRTDLVREVGGFRLGFEGSQDYDLSLRVVERIDERQIRHIPRVLYHWRVIRGSVAFSMDEKPYAHERARKAIREHFVRTGVDAEVTESFHNLHRVNYVVPNRRPRVTQIVTEQGQVEFDAKRVPVALYHETMTIDPAKATRIRALNTAAARSTGDVLFFVDSDLTLMPGCSIEDIVAAAMQEGIGAVSGRILSPKLRVESAGIVLTEDLLPARAHRGFPREVSGNMYRNRQAGNWSAVSISCLAIRRELFELLGGFDVDLGPQDLFDVDLCLRLREIDKRVVVLPHIEFVREAEATDVVIDAQQLNEFQRRWPRYAAADPFCNPNLKRDGSFDIDV